MTVAPKGLIQRPETPVKPRYTAKLVAELQADSTPKTAEDWLASLSDDKRNTVLQKMRMMQTLQKASAAHTKERKHWLVLIDTIYKHLPDHEKTFMAEIMQAADPVSEAEQIKSVQEKVRQEKEAADAYSRATQSFYD